MIKKVETPTFKLSSNNIHVWTSHLKTLTHTSLLDDGFLLLEEKLRKMRFATQWLKEKFLYSHVILRLLISKYLQVPLSEIRYKYGMYDKPFFNLKGKTFIFNMSHSNEWVAYGFSITSNIGIDIEEYAKEFSVIELSRAVFNQDEQKHLMTINSGKRKAYFLRIWTAKEAFLKMLGIGIGDFLGSIYFDNNWNAFLPGMAYHQKNYAITGKIQHVIHKQHIVSVSFSTVPDVIIYQELKDVKDLFTRSYG
ncbi:4'-phosphopantetheinyl transferase family protein [Candidatus Protochlamydia sp. W-9]|uniref:4'-phosphopantetheinyl transferase family protein n=1 Tax=Candidatus Protochlamydia sp. W-9 TaxID=1785087 RepID=UPI00096A83CF|nr:4'-phosphopantetheinyl transferase superfamily protein [Candidatus Protochlamydia sp. W-9]